MKTPSVVVGFRPRAGSRDLRVAAARRGGWIARLRAWLGNR